MGNKTKGLRKVSVEGFGPIEWDIFKIEAFETAAQRKLRSLGSLGEAVSVEADLILNNFRSAWVIQLALQAILPTPGKDEKIEDIINDGIKTYLSADDNHSLKTLQREIHAAFRLFDSPSTESSLRQNWRTLDEIERMKAEARTKTELKTAITTLQMKLRSAPDGEAVSPSSSSDSGPTKPAD